MSPTPGLFWDRNVDFPYSPPADIDPNVDLDARNPNKLPRGCLWHGATVLRANEMTGKRITVAVIATGIDATHPGFKKKTIISQDSGPRDNTPTNLFEERTTHLAGTIHFMAPDAKIRDYNVFNGESFAFDEKGANSVFAKITRALKIAVLVDEVDLVLLPIGWNGTNELRGAAIEKLKAAIEIAKENNVHVVCPATGFKELAPTVFAVDGVTKQTNLPKIYTKLEEDGRVVTLPREPIDYVAQSSNEYSFKWGGGFSQMSGAAVAAAHFTGLLACILSKYKKIIPKDEKISREKLQEIINEKYNVTINRPSKDGYGNGIATALAGQEGVERFTDLRGKVADIAKTEIPTGQPDIDDIVSNLNPVSRFRPTGNEDVEAVM